MVPSELGVFYKYVENAASIGMFNAHFEHLAKLFCLFVDRGYLQSQTDFYFSTVFALKKEIFSGKGISPDVQINLIWSLTALEVNQVSNPLIPKLLEDLTSFKRELPITSQEL